MKVEVLIFQSNLRDPVTSHDFLEFQTAKTCSVESFEILRRVCLKHFSGKEIYQAVSTKGQHLTLNHIKHILLAPIRSTGVSAFMEKMIVQMNC